MAENAHEEMSGSWGLGIGESRAGRTVAVREVTQGRRWRKCGPRPCRSGNTALRKVPGTSFCPRRPKTAKRAKKKLWLQQHKRKNRRQKRDFSYRKWFVGRGGGGAGGVRGMCARLINSTRCCPILSTPHADAVYLLALPFLSPVNHAYPNSPSNLFQLRFVLILPWHNVFTSCVFPKAISTGLWNRKRNRFLKIWHAQKKKKKKQNQNHLSGDTYTESGMMQETTNAEHVCWYAHSVLSTESAIQHEGIAIS